jgi:3-oxoacyl-[acyl-carrier-protein] synthase-3
MTFNCHISGRGKYLPQRSIPNEDLPNADSQWTFDNLGIKERRQSNWNEDVVFMGHKAGGLAVLDAGIQFRDIGLVIVSCSSPSNNAPNISSQIIALLNIKTRAIDINVVCTGFLYALETACAYIETGITDNVLVIATEQYSSITDYSSRDCVYFGDGSGAVVVSRGSGTMRFNLTADGKSGDAFVCETRSNFTMVGSKVYSKAMEVLPRSISYILFDAGLDIEDIDYLVPHQAGIRVLQDLCKEIKLPFDKCITIMDKYANLASASIPVALNEIEIRDKTILLAAIGSGWTWGSAIIKQSV